MAMVNKTSLREEFDSLKARYQRLSEQGEMSAAQAHALIRAMFKLFELLMAVFMERRTRRNPKNSSLPSSQTSKDDTALSRPGAHGKGPSQKAIRADHTRTVETVEVAQVEACGHCGEDLSQTPCQGHERRTQIDLVVEKVVKHVDAQIKQSPRCQKQSRGRFAADFAGPRQYGAGVKAHVVHLLTAQMLSLKRVQQSMQALIGEKISAASLLKYVMQVHHALARWEQSAKQALLAMPALHADETSLRVDRHTHWIHVYSGGQITLKYLHPKRGRTAIDGIGIIPRYGGVVIHDCWASYLAYDHCGHGLCGSHLLRELTFVEEVHDYAWAKQMKRLLQRTRERVAKREDKRLSDAEYKKLQKHYRTILTQGAKQLPTLPPRQNGKRGRVAKSQAHSLWERLQKHEQAVLLFAKNPDVAFTNNRAERDLRMSKVKQKVSGCFRTSQYAEAYCRISSYLQTMAYQEYNPLIAIQMALSGELYEE